MSGAVATERPDDALRLDQQICFSFYAATHLISRLYAPVLADLGLTYPQYLVMLVLWEDEPQSVGSLGDKLHLDSGTLTPLLKRLEKAEVIRRDRDPGDERRVLVTLTETGRAMKERARRVPEAMARQYPVEDTAQMHESICRFNAILSAHAAANRLSADGPANAAQRTGLPKERA